MDINRPEETPPRKIPVQLPLLPIRDIVVFPRMVLPLTVSRDKSMRALEVAMTLDRLIFLTTQRRAHIDEPVRENLFEIGTVAMIRQFLKMPDGTQKVLLEGISRARLMDYHLVDGNYVRADIQELMETTERVPEVEALMRQCLSLFEQYVKLQRRIPAEVITTLSQIESAGHLADAVAWHLFVRVTDKQEILEIPDVKRRLERLVEILHGEVELFHLQKRIQSRTRSQIEKSQKEYYLTEQMKAIQKELRKKDDLGQEMDQLKKQIKKAKMTKEAQEAAEKELQRLEKMLPMSPEATVSRTYLDWLIHLPWAVHTTDNLDLKNAEKILNEDHYGLEKAKERVLEYLAVLKLVKQIKGPILCFVGPPGVGKTSLARSIARSLGRHFVRISLGGVRDEAEVRGHRRTYIGSLPGRLVQSLRKAKSKNPVILLDEIDKMGSDWRGDPAAALLEVLDPEQNQAFVDHYLDVGFDLSQIMFVTTANTLYTIPPTLQDRLEVIRFPGYTTEEKITIAEKFLIPKQMKEHGLKAGQLSISDQALKLIIKDYTQEAGVRNLEREIANLCRKAARLLVSETKGPIRVAPVDLQKLLGIPKFHREKATPNAVGVATGLAWTEHGGETLSVEVTIMPGRGKLILTGKLGEVMQESAQAALSYIRSLADSLKIRKDATLKNRDMHIHVPEGAVPKDGPSAGIAMAAALASALTGRAVKKDVAMTGEITLRGRVLPIGGLKEKVLAAYREGVHTVLFPQGNEKDLEEIPKNVQKQIKLIPVRTMADVLTHALEPRRHRVP
jgi:ATP-dependent Lon protease